MKKLKYLLLIFIVFLTPNVFAAEFNMNNYSSASLNGTKNRYRATEIYNTGMSYTYTFGSQYNGRISDIEVYFDYPFSANTSYRFTYNMNTKDFRNNFGSSYWWDCSNGNDMTNINAHVVSVSYISYTKVQVSVTPSANTTCIRLWLRSTNILETPITGVSNWRLNNITIYDPDWQNGTTSGSGSQGTTSGSTTGTSTTNTNQDIIDNANQNTTDIIDNANQNTDREIDSQKVCKDYNYTQTNVNKFDGYLTSNGSVVDGGASFKHTDYIPLNKGTDYTLTTNFTNNNLHYCLYKDDKTLISCQRYNSQSFTINLTDDGFIRYSTRNTYEVNFTGKYCQNGNQAINDYLSDDSNPNIPDSDFTNLFNSVGFSDPLSYLLQLPVQFINQIVSQSNTCQTISLGTLWGVSLSLPCINIGNIIGQQVWDIIDVLFSVGLLVVIFKNLYQTFANLMTMGGEKEAREKFSMPTPMEFLSIILGGDR